MKKIISVLIFLAFFSSVQAQEQIVGFEDKDLPVLNEELRKKGKEIRDLETDLTSTTTTTNTKYIYFLIPDDTLTTGADKLGRIYVDFAGTISAVHASVKTAPTGASIIVDLNKNGSTIWSTQGNRVTIAATEYTGTQSTFNTTTFASGDYFTIDLDTVGSSVAGAKLVVRLKILKS